MKISVYWLLFILSLPLIAFGSDDHPCGNFKEEIPKDWYQGTISVPENPDDENGPRINVFYYGQLSKDQTPVVFFNGGPGQHSHDAFYIISRAQKLFDAKKSLSFIFIDQRGTGCSDFYPQGSADSVLQRLSHYGSRGIVADAEAIRKKHFGTKPWIIFGQSYGAHIVHRYATLYPKSIKAAFAHGNALNTSAYDRFKFRIASQVRVMDEYLKIYPGDEKALGILATELELDVCFQYGAKKDKKACGWEVTEDLMSSYLGSFMNWNKLHQWLEAMTDEDSINRPAIQNYVENSFVDESEVFSKKWASRVLAWTDRNTAPYDRRHCSFIQYELFNKDIEIERNAFTECSSILQNPESNLDNWGRKMVKFLRQDTLSIEQFKNALLEASDLKFYLYSGRMDPFVPEESYQEEISALKNVNNLIYRNFLTSGHEGYQTEGRIWKDMINESKK
jgi:pimeloyl-ACP methyl ester carboxylesterase